MTRDFQLEGDVRVIHTRMSPPPKHPRPVAQQLAPRPWLHDSICFGGGLGRALVIDLVDRQKGETS